MIETKWKQEIADIIWVYELKKLWNNTSITTGNDKKEK